MQRIFDRLRGGRDWAASAELFVAERRKMAHELLGRPVR
jgi:hypothetical protein